MTDTSGSGSWHGLKCLGGREAPADVSKNLKQISALPRSARDRFWQALASVLTEPIAPSAEKALNEFCAAHNVARDNLMPPLAAARFVVRAASFMDSSAEDFASDVATLTDGDLDIASMLLGGYDVCKQVVRNEVKQTTLRDHGKLFTGLHWRVDVLSSSSRGASLKMPVATLTLHYTEGDKKKRITLQMQPEGVAELKRVCEQILA